MRGRLGTSVLGRGAIPGIRSRSGYPLAVDTRPAALLLTATLAAAGLEVALVATPVRPLGAEHVLLLWAIAWSGTAALLLPALLLPRERLPGLILGGLALLHGAVALRFGPLVNHGAASPLLLGGWAALAVVTLGGGWALGPSVPVPRRTPWVLAVLGVLGLQAGVVRSAPAGHATATGPNLLLVTMDTVRADSLPYMDELQALAAGGVRFDQAIAAAPLTGPSHLSILTGQDVLTHGVVANGTPVGEQPTLAVALSAAGWHTAAFVSGFPVHGRFGLDRGFDVYDDDFGALPGLHRLAVVRAFDAVVWRNLPRERRGDRVNASVARWLASNPPEPWFAWVHYYDPHGPYTPPPDWDTAGEPDGTAPPADLPQYWPPKLRAIGDLDWHTARYHDEVRWTDHLLAEVLDGVAPYEPLVVVTADHGESLTEHGILFNHGDDLHDPSLRVPLVVAGPGVRPGTVGCQVSGVDLAPTLLAWAGVDDGVVRDGVDRSEVLRGAPCVDADAWASTVAARTPDPPVDHALRRPAAKLIHHGAGGVSCYDLAADPGELDSGAACDPELERLLEVRVQGGDVRAAPADADALHQLEALGYLEGPERP